MQLLQINKAQDSIALAKRDSIQDKVNEYYLKQDSLTKLAKEKHNLIESSVAQVDFRASQKGMNNVGALSIFLIVSFSLLVIARVFQPANFNLLISGFFDHKVLRVASREEFLKQSLASIVLYANFCLVLAILVAETVCLFDIPTSLSYLNIIIICAGIIFSAYLIKLFTTRFWEVLFGKDASIGLYRFITLLFCNAIGVVIFPLVVLITYADEWLKFYLFFGAMTIIGSLFLYRLIIGIVNAIQSSVSPFYIFLYLCTLEILPLVVLFKLLMS